MAVSKTVGWGFDSLRPCHFLERFLFMLNPVDFMSQVRQEMQRVAWPTSKETTAMTVAVLIMVICAMIYFFFTDAVICWALSNILV